MKKYILLLFVFTSFLAHSQFGGNRMGNQRQRQMSQTPRPAPEPNFEIEKYLGIVIYDIEKAAKKSKVKLSSETGKQFSTFLTNYNKEIKEIKRIYSFTLKSTKEMMESFQKKATETKDFSNSTEVQKKMGENLAPISEILKEKDIEFNRKIEALLSNKQFDKWIKYNRSIYKVFPKEDDDKKIKE